MKGGYVTPNIYVPKSVWSQRDFKYTGLSFKVAAFEQIYVMLTTTITPLEKSLDKTSLEYLLRTFVDFSDGLLVIQNNLSKPFPFIHEVEEPIANVNPKDDNSQVLTD